MHFLENLEPRSPKHGHTEKFSVKAETSQPAGPISSRMGLIVTMALARRRCPANFVGGRRTLRRRPWSKERQVIPSCRLTCLKDRSEKVYELPDMQASTFIDHGCQDSYDERRCDIWNFQAHRRQYQQMPQPGRLFLANIDCSTGVWHLDSAGLGRRRYHARNCHVILSPWLRVIRTHPGYEIRCSQQSTLRTHGTGRPQVSSGRRRGERRQGTVPATRCGSSWENGGIPWFFSIAAVSILFLSLSL